MDKKFFVIESDTDTLEAYKDNLKGIGWKERDFYLFSDINTGRNIIIRERIIPYYLILNYVTPRDMRGLYLIEELHKVKLISKINKIALISGYMTSTIEKKIESYGSNIKCFKKPFDTDILEKYFPK